MNQLKGVSGTVLCSILCCEIIWSTCAVCFVSFLYRCATVSNDTRKGATQVVYSDMADSSRTCLHAGHCALASLSVQLG